MIDLHLHTYYSDGTMSPDGLVNLASINGINTIAITDHDGIGGIKEGIAAGEKYGVRIINGIELSAEDEEKRYMHILGYCFDIENQELLREVSDIRQKRVERNEKILLALEEIGCPIKLQDLQLRPGQDYVGKPTFAMALANKGYVSFAKDAFEEGRFMRSKEVRKIHRDKISVERAIEIIKAAGGIAVLAHPMKIGNFNPEDDYFEKLEDLIINLKKIGLGGMECYYSGHLHEESERLVKLAKKHKLIITAGSDFHGLELDKDLLPGGFTTDKNFDENQILNKIERSVFDKVVL